ncbi:MAG TPA: hypothetical protein VIX73_18520 [Kofleriaceae bacterium]
MKKTTNRQALLKRPLVLERETIRHLSGGQLSRAAGGILVGSDLCTDACTASCPTHCDGCSITRTDLCGSNGMFCSATCTSGNL